MLRVPELRSARQLHGNVHHATVSLKMKTLRWQTKRGIAELNADRPRDAQCSTKLPGNVHHATVILKMKTLRWHKKRGVATVAVCVRHMLGDRIVKSSLNLQHRTGYLVHLDVL